MMVVLLSEGWYGSYGAHLGPHGCMGVTICVLCLGPVGQVGTRHMFLDPGLCVHVPES
jgi:hypothetical protein